MYVVKDSKGITHEVRQRGRAFTMEGICGVSLKHWEGDNLDEPVTCLVCSTGLTKNCGHVRAVVRNCPYEGDVHGNPAQRCKCCERCQEGCAGDV